MSKFQLSPDESAFYSSQSAFSDPGESVTYYADLPNDPAALAAIARGLLIHRLEGPLFGHTIADDRMRLDAETRYLDDILRIVIARDAAPLTKPRAAADRFVGVCRDFTLLHCSLLRHVGIPARMRIGFADYFGAHHDDHVVTEYWDPAQGWLLADAQLAALEIVKAHEIDFSPMNVPRDRFLTTAPAWQAIRTGQADPNTFGNHDPDRPLLGAWFVAGSVRLDLAALNKDEALLWDVWGAAALNDTGLTDQVRALHDRAAEVTGGEVSFEAVRKLYAEEDGLRIPQTVLSFQPFGEPTQVTLRSATS